MKTYSTLPVLGVVCLAAAVVSSLQAETVVYRLTTKGSGYQRGLQHGKQFREAVRRELYSPGRAKVREIAKHPKTVAQFLNTVRSLPGGGELVDEIQGIAEGAEVPFVQLAALNLWRPYSSGASLLSGVASPTVSPQFRSTRPAGGGPASSSSCFEYSIRTGWKCGKPVSLSPRSPCS